MRLLRQIFGWLLIAWGAFILLAIVISAMTGYFKHESDAVGLIIVLLLIALIPGAIGYVLVSYKPIKKVKMDTHQAVNFVQTVTANSASIPVVQPVMGKNRSVLGYFKNKRREKAVIEELTKRYAIGLKPSGADIIDVETADLETFYGLSEKELITYGATARKVLGKQIFNSAVNGNTKWLSPEEYSNLILQFKRLNIDAKFDAKTNIYVEKLRQYWKIEFEPLQTVYTNVSLPDGEGCYYECQCEWYEMRRVTKSVSYRGTSTSIKIVKGLRYHIGSVTPSRITNDELIKIDSGRLIITNKRLIFNGRMKNVNVGFGKILSITPYSDAVEIIKDSGKSPTIKCTDPDILARILLKILNG